MRRRIGDVGVLVASGASLLLLLSPLAYAVWISFSPGELLEPPTGAWSLRWYRTFFATAQWTDGLLESLRVAAASVVLAVACGGGLALAIARHRFRGRGGLTVATLLPLFVPGVVLGMGLLPFLRAIGLWGTSGALALAHAVISLPVVFLVVRTAVADVDPDLERAARGLGATPWQATWRVTVPLVGPGVAVAAVMAFILSLNEFVVALFLGTAETETLPKVIWPSLRYTLSPLVAAASGVVLLLTLAGLAVACGMLRLARRT